MALAQADWLQAIERNPFIYHGKAVSRSSIILYRFCEDIRVAASLPQASAESRTAPRPTHTWLPLGS